MKKGKKDNTTLLYSKEVSTKLATLYISGDYILTVNHQSETHYIGFDCITEKLVRVPKETAIPIPDVVVNLLGNEEIRLRVASCIADHSRKVISKFLNVNERSVYRQLVKYGIDELMSEDEMQGKIVVKQKSKQYNKEAEKHETAQVNS